jgi:peptidoglycan hydrolase-like protein with peptidoglycan-binding domain/3D (Asp-Asp-Asp) domain-containing protein
MYTQKINICPPRRILLTVMAMLLLTPLRAGSTLEPYDQNFIITAYYSPLPDQCCYVTGGYSAEKILNGEGVRAADGTAVYPGMLAAPPAYAFGTKVTLPGIGTLAVHDRGGAIQKLSGGAHRLDIWVGKGEEGLARALEFGIQHMNGTVYPPGFEQPQAHVQLDSLPAPISRLKKFKLNGTSLISVRPKKDEKGLSVAMLQEELHEVGYFRHGITGLFGDVTEKSLSQFLQDYHVSEPSNVLTKISAAHLLSAARRHGVEGPIGSYIDKGSKGDSVKEAQRILRFFGHYRGRTDGVYSEELAAAILQFQQKEYLVGTAQDPGAGRIGPLTMQKIRGAWDRALVNSRAKRLVALHDIEKYMKDRNLTVQKFLSEGDYGSQVKRLQEFLVDRGFFPAGKVNGSFGPLTKESVMAFQIARGILGSAKDHGAGVVGPTTLSLLQREENINLYRLVRAEGWQAL